MKPSVVVVGGGLCGLSAAYRLRERGIEVTLLEADSRIGGRIRSECHDGFLFERGPAAIGFPRAAFEELCQDVGIADRIIGSESEARTRHIYYRGKLHPVPRSFRQFLRSHLFTLRQKLRVLCEPLMPTGHPDERCVAEFFGRRVGRGITMTWVDVLVSATYAGNPNRLGMNSAFPELWELEQQYGSVFRGMWSRMRKRRKRVKVGAEPPRYLTLEGGLETLAKELDESLGSRVRCGRSVSSIVRENGGFRLVHRGVAGDEEELHCSKILLAVSPQATGILLGPLAPDVADLLFEIEMASLVVVSAGFDRESMPGLPEGAGWLIPRSQRMRTLGWSSISQSFPHMAPEGKVSLHAILGGTLDPRMIDMKDDALRHIVLGEMALALRQRKLPVPEVWEVARFRNAIPQYNVGHKRRVAAVRHLLSDHVPGIELAGDWFNGLSPDACIAAGREAALRIADGLTSEASS